MHQPDRQNQNLHSYLHRWLPVITQNPFNLDRDIRWKLWNFKQDVRVFEKYHVVGTYRERINRILNELENENFRRLISHQKRFSWLACGFTAATVIAIVFALPFLLPEVVGAFVASLTASITGIVLATIIATLAVLAISALAFFITYSVCQIKINKQRANVRAIAQRIRAEEARLTENENTVNDLLERETSLANEKQAQLEKAFSQIKIDPASEASKLSKDTFGHVLSFSDLNSLGNARLVSKGWKDKVDTYIEDTYSKQGKVLIAVCIDPASACDSYVSGCLYDSVNNPLGRFGRITALNEVTLLNLDALATYRQSVLETKELLNELGEEFDPIEHELCEVNIEELERQLPTQNAAQQLVTRQTIEQEKISRQNKRKALAREALTEKLHSSWLSYLAKAEESGALREAGISIMARREPDRDASAPNPCAFFILEVPKSLLDSSTSAGLRKLNLRPDEFHLVAQVFNCKLIFNEKYQGSEIAEIIQSALHDNPRKFNPRSDFFIAELVASGIAEVSYSRWYYVKKREGVKKHLSDIAFDKNYNLIRALRGRDKQKVLFVVAVPDLENPQDVSKVKYFSVMALPEGGAIQARDLQRHVSLLLRSLKALQRRFSELSLYALEFDDLTEYQRVREQVNSTIGIFDISSELSAYNPKPIMSLSFNTVAQASADRGGLFASANPKLAPVVKLAQGHRLFMQHLYAIVKAGCASELDFKIEDVTSVEQTPLLPGEVAVTPDKAEQATPPATRLFT